MHRLPIHHGGVCEPTYFILVSLSNEPLHGYGIAKRAEELSDGRVRIGAGTLYGALDRLVDDGLIVIEREAVVNGRPRRYYRLTPSGRDAVVAEVTRMRSALEAAGAGGFEIVGALA